MKAKKPIWNESILAIITCTLGFSVFVAAEVYAQDYPVFYDNENPTYGNVAVPEPEFPTEPGACEPDDEKCIDAYLDQMGLHIKGSVNSQMSPNPVYSWKDGDCVIDNPEKCKTMNDEWEVWMNKAASASLDFVQGPEQKKEICNSVYDWWGMRYAYNCQNGEDIKE